MFQDGSQIFFVYVYRVCTINDNKVVLRHCTGRMVDADVINHFLSNLVLWLFDTAFFSAKWLCGLSLNLNRTFGAFNGYLVPRKQFDQNLLGLSKERYF